MTLVAKPRRITAKSRFRLEIDGIGDMRLTTLSEIKLTREIIETEEGGAPTTVELSPNKYKYEPLTAERPLTEDMALVEWDAALKRGVQDKRNGAIYQLDTEGKDLLKWPLEECIIAEFTEGSFDAKAGSEGNMEKVVIRYRERGKRQLLQ